MAQGNPLIVAAQTRNRNKILHALIVHDSVVISITESGKDAAALARSLIINMNELAEEVEPDELEHLEIDPLYADNPLVVAAQRVDRQAYLELLLDRLALIKSKITSGRDSAPLSRQMNIISKALSDITGGDDADTEELEGMRARVRDKQAISER